MLTDYQEWELFNEKTFNSFRFDFDLNHTIINHFEHRNIDEYLHFNLSKTNKKDYLISVSIWKWRFDMIRMRDPLEKVKWLGDFKPTLIQQQKHIPKMELLTALSLADKLCYIHQKDCKSFILDGRFCETVITLNNNTIRFLSYNFNLQNENLALLVKEIHDINKKHLDLV